MAGKTQPPSDLQDHDSSASPPKLEGGAKKSPRSIKAVKSKALSTEGGTHHGEVATPVARSGADFLVNDAQSKQTVPSSAGIAAHAPQVAVDESAVPGTRPVKDQTIEPKGKRAGSGLEIAPAKGAATEPVEPQAIKVEDKGPARRSASAAADSTIMPVGQAAGAKETRKSRAREAVAKAEMARFPSEAEFVAKLPPLPTEDLEQAEAVEQKCAIEAEYHDLAPMEESSIDLDWEGVAVVEPEVMPEPQPDHVPRPPAIPSLFIVQITPELAPVAKVGGLADVVFGLSNEMEIRGNNVEIILPKYDCLRYDHIWGLCETHSDLRVPWYGGAIHCTVFFGFVHGRKCFFIEPHSGDKFFNRGGIYGFSDDVMRFAFFSRAAMEFLWRSGKHPDIIHCHDWQTALVPVFLYEIYQNLGMRHPRTCFTIHNFKHQGVIGAQLLNATGLHRPEHFFHYDRMRDNHNPHALNLTKAGVVYSNFVSTVSPRHALEAKDQGQGFGLEPTLHIHHLKYGGVVNGIDYEVWNPELDRYIPFHYSLNSIDDKYRNKRALRGRLMVAENEKPIIAFIGRLDPQKGLELIRHAIFYTLQRGGQFVLLGSSPDGQINNYFWSLKHQLNDHPDCHIEIGFNEELSHLIYAGADMVIVPSRFEPCGLTQLIAMRYGTIPVVRDIGGLADTVIDKDFSHRPLHERNGYVFRDYDDSGLESALGRAISCYYEYPEHFRELMKNAMRCDYSWKNPGQDYLNIYDHILDN